MMNTMTEVIGDFLERQAARHEMSGARVPEHMRTATRHLKAEPLDAVRDNGIQAFRGHRSDGRPDLQNQLTTRASRPSLFEVPDDRLSDDGHERIDLGTARLGATDRQTVVLPIDVVKAQRGDLTGPEAIDRQQQEDRAVSDVRPVIGRRVLDQPIDVVPRGTDWQATKVRATDRFFMATDELGDLERRQQPVRQIGVRRPGLCSGVRVARSMRRLECGMRLHTLFLANPSDRL